MTSRLLIVAPTAREFAGTERAVPGLHTVVVGMGETSADATRKALTAHVPTVLLSIGFSGALDPGLRTGDIVVSDSVLMAATGRRLELDPTHAASVRGLLEAAGIAVRPGATLTTKDPVLSSARKLSYHKTTKTSIVDMETTWIATAAREAGIPMLSVRTVIDEARHDLPRFVGNIIADGGRNEWRHAFRATLNPLTVVPMLALALRARKASARTRAMLDVLIPALTGESGTLEPRP